jgi:hypothetical protein
MGSKPADGDHLLTLFFCPGSSTDQKTWTSLPMTLQAKTGVSGLTAGTTYYFRVQPVTRTGAESWSQIVTLLVK